MTSPRIAVATCDALPDLDDDGDRLLAALRTAGADPVVAVWDDPGHVWDEDLVLIRTTWDYTARHHEFVAWAQARRRTANPAPMVAWNVDKHYLDDLAAAGLATVPSTFLAPSDPWPGLPGDRPVVVKPAVGASSEGAVRTDDDATAREAATVLQQAGRDVVVQPYLGAIERVGETSLIHLAGRLSHAVVKPPLLTDGGRRPVGDGHDDHDERDWTSRFTRAEPSSAAVALAESALAAARRLTGATVDYARVDLLETDDGQPVLLELELVEPSLWLQWAADDDVARFADAVVARARA